MSDVCGWLGRWEESVIWLMCVCCVLYNPFLVVSSKTSSLLVMLSIYPGIRCTTNLLFCLSLVRSVSSRFFLRMLCMVLVLVWGYIPGCWVHPGPSWPSRYPRWDPPVQFCVLCAPLVRSWVNISFGAGEGRGRGRGTVRYGMVRCGVTICTRRRWTESVVRGVWVWWYWMSYSVCNETMRQLTQLTQLAIGGNTLEYSVLTCLQWGLLIQCVQYNIQWI